MSHLFTPLTIRGVTFKNRIAVSPMCQYSSKDGFANDWHLVHLGSRAVGGAGLVMQEATAVSPEGRITPDDMGLYLQQHVAMLSRITSFVHQQGAVAGIQLAHAGRKASHLSPWKGGKQIVFPDPLAWSSVAPSAIPFLPDESAPESLDKQGIQKIIGDFRRAATLAVEAGFRVVEIHAAHGYLFHEFLSPLSNNRTDEYGGEFENRIRLLMEAVAAIKEALPQKQPLFVRLSCTDWIEGGWDIDQTVRLCAKLQRAGVDLIDCSSGGTSPAARIPLAPGYQVGFAARIRKELNLLTGAVGLITTPEQAEEILASGQADMILLAREMLRNPYFPQHAAKALGADISWPVQYERAKPKS